jgi:ribose 5-phosphate isomerase A
MTTAAAEKKRVGFAAAELVEAGMIVGLGTGSSAAFFVDGVAARGLSIRCVPTSEATAAMARTRGLEVVSLRDVDRIALTVDGVDEVDTNLRAIKGGGGALMREKIVASLSEQVVYIGDSTKLVGTLGAFPLPVEVSPFAAPAIQRQLANAGAEVTLREVNGQPFVSDEGHWILDAAFQKIDDPEHFDALLNATPGVVAHGLFIGLIDRMLIARGDEVKALDRVA